MVTKQIMFTWRIDPLYNQFHCVYFTKRTWVYKCLEDFECDVKPLCLLLREKDLSVWTWRFLRLKPTPAGRSFCAGKTTLKRCNASICRPKCLLALWRKWLPKRWEVKFLRFFRSSPLSLLYSCAAILYQFEFLHEWYDYDNAGGWGRYRTDHWRIWVRRVNFRIIVGLSISPLDQELNWATKCTSPRFHLAFWAQGTLPPTHRKWSAGSERNKLHKTARLSCTEKSNAQEKLIGVRMYLIWKWHESRVEEM